MRRLAHGFAPARIEASFDIVDVEASLFTHTL
jgi:hypothetical protein